MTLEVLTPPSVTDQRKINLQFQDHDLIYLLVNLQNIADLHSGLSRPTGDLIWPQMRNQTMWHMLMLSLCEFPFVFHAASFTVCGVASIVLRGNAASLTGLVVMQLYTSMYKCTATLIFHL